MNGEEKKLFLKIGKEMGRLAEAQENLADDMKEVKDFIHDEAATRDDVMDAIGAHEDECHDVEKKIGHAVVGQKDNIIRAALLAITIILAAIGIRVYIPF